MPWRSSTASRRIPTSRRCRRSTSTRRCRPTSTTQARPTARRTSRPGRPAAGRGPSSRARRRGGRACATAVLRSARKRAEWVRTRCAPSIGNPNVRPAVVAREKGRARIHPRNRVGHARLSGGDRPRDRRRRGVVGLAPPSKRVVAARNGHRHDTAKHTLPHARASTPTVPLAEAYPAGAPNGSGRFCAKRASSKLGMRDLYGMPTSSPNGISVSASMRIM